MKCVWRHGLHSQQSPCEAQQGLPSTPQEETQEGVCVRVCVCVHVCVCVCESKKTEVHALSFHCKFHYCCHKAAVFCVSVRTRVCVCVRERVSVMYSLFMGLSENIFQFWSTAVHLCCAHQFEVCAIPRVYKCVHVVEGEMNR